jgi:hypothetical protein
MTFVQGNFPKLKSDRPQGFHESKIGIGSVRTKARRQELENKIDINSLGLSETSRQIYLNNPHLRQVFLNRRPLITNNFTEHIGVINMATAPHTCYQSRMNEAKTTVHSGQRKLLNMEIEFLTQYAVHDATVIYVGAAPGHHHTILEVLFPFITFILYDPRGFPIKSTPRREINRIMFTHVTAQELLSRFKEKRCLFISDIRRHDDENTNINNERLIQEDMQMQFIWVQILNPMASLLKFRPPYPLTDELSSIQYFKGIILIQPWTGATSTETRLLVTDRYKRTIYDSKLYEDIMFHFNTVTRTTYYQNENNRVCHCYDCSAEKLILDHYYSKYPSLQSNDRSTIEKLITIQFSM